MNGRIDNVRSSHRSNEQLFSRDSHLRAGEELPLASHLVTPRALYRHHGIYVGNGRVIHYAGLAHGLRRGPVEDVSLDRFAHGHSIRVRHDGRSFDRYEVVERARSRLGEHSYRILTNNCEHFCAWALRNENRSSRVERLHATVQAVYERIERHHRAIVRALRLGWDRSRPMARPVRSGGPDWMQPS